MSGGETGIRTLGTLSRSTVFKSGKTTVFFTSFTLFTHLTYTHALVYAIDAPNMFHRLFHGAGMNHSSMVGGTGLLRLSRQGMVWRLDPVLVKLFKHRALVVLQRRLRYTTPSEIPVCIESHKGWFGALYAWRMFQFCSAACQLAPAGNTLTKNRKLEGQNRHKC